MSPNRRMLFSAILCLVTAIILSQYASPLSRWAKSFVTKTQSVRPLSENNTPSRNMSRTPVYFMSHGGPNIMEDYQHPAYKKLQEIGREITQKVNPKGVVVFSAHWQAEPSTVQVNTAEITELIYE